MIVSLSRRKKSEESFFDDPNAKMPDDNNGRLSLLLAAFSSVQAIRPSPNEHQPISFISICFPKWLEE
jgi:hypothetical protein